MKGEETYLPPCKKTNRKTSDMEHESWHELRRRINGVVNKVTANNLSHVVMELFEENLIRGRGLLCRSCMKSQIASPKFSDVISALVAVVNSRFPCVGDLLLRRLVLQIRRSYDRNDKPLLLAVITFFAHLVNQRVACETSAFEILLMLLDEPTKDTVEVAIAFVTECGATLRDVSPRAFCFIFERFLTILLEGDLDYRSGCLIESLFALRRSNFKGHPAIRPQLDVLEPDEQCTHDISFFGETNPETFLDVFRPDPEFHKNERLYHDLKRQILGEEEEEEDEEEEEEEEDEEEEEEDEEEDDDDVAVDTIIQDVTETDLVELRRTIYLTIMSTLSFEEAGHKLLRIKLEPDQQIELCSMILGCCTEERIYRSFYGHLAQRFCLTSKIYRHSFEKLFVEQYMTVHRLDTVKLRNVAMFFSHLLATDALPWHALAYVRLTEEDTTSSSRIFVKVLFQELSEQMGIKALSEKLLDPTMEETFKSIFPTDHPKNTRFSINFFASIGLGCITPKFRELLLAKRQKHDTHSRDETQRKRRRL
ncbi:unnamed protein product [Cochlearia groenlandica]